MHRLVFLLFMVVRLYTAGVVVAGSGDEEEEELFSRYDFPTGFKFGSGTSAYQVEGAANEDGRTPSIWDTFAHDGYVHGATGDVACDGYHKYKEDVQLMVETGLDAYRFSISWSRLIPHGRGPVNPKGLQYYNNLINELLKHGIEPHVTLYNIDLPQDLEDEYGGWVSRKIVKDFAAYAEVCFREFGDRVKYWCTVNEPNIFAIGGYDQGLSPPRRCSSPFGLNCRKGNSTTEPYLVGHFALLAHASAAKIYRKKYQSQTMIPWYQRTCRVWNVAAGLLKSENPHGARIIKDKGLSFLCTPKQRGFIGISIYTFGVVPYSNTTADVNAAQRATDFFTGWLVNPLVYGDYPDIMKKNVGSRLPTFTRRESLEVKGSFDFIGLIHYSVITIKDKSSSLNTEPRDFNADMGIKLVNYNLTALQLPIDAWGLQQVLELFKQVYGNPPLYIYENGQRMVRNKTLDDIDRINYIQAYIGATLDAVRNGSNTRGYFTWSFMDLFELIDGYVSSYGHYYVDLDDPDLKRYPKRSAYWYSSFLKGKRVGASVDKFTHLSMDENASHLRQTRAMQ